MSKLCDGCNEEFEPIGREWMCLSCKRRAQVESQRRWEEKKKNLASIDSESAVNEIMEVLDGKKDAIDLNKCIRLQYNQN